MPSRPFQAFVSSTYQDLKDHRARVIKDLRRSKIYVDPMEDWTADSDEPKAFSQDRVEGCDFCILLVAFKRGYVPKGETYSITQLEYQKALNMGIAVLVFMLGENEPWSPQFDERDSDPEVRKWRSELEQRHGRELFKADSSSLDVLPAILRWIHKYTHPVVASMSELADKLASHKEELRNRRGEVVSYLERTCDLIQFAHDELAADRTPHGTCQQIFDTGERLVNAIGNDISIDDLHELQRLLQGAYKVEMLHDALRTEKDKRLNLAELDRTRGSFAALVEAIRFAPPSRP